MEQVVSVLLLYFVNCVTHSLPINNGFMVKLYPISAKEDLTSKTFGAMFAKIPQEPTPGTTLSQEILSEGHFPHAIELGSGCTNQIAKITYQFKSCIYNDTKSRKNPNFINLPLIKQPFDEYKILVVTAPPNVKIGDTNKSLVIYVVFSENAMKDLDSINIPSIYFVNKIKDKVNKEKKVHDDPIFIVDSNRTVTGLKSKEISKHIKFRNKLIGRFDYKLVP